MTVFCGSREVAVSMTTGPYQPSPKHPTEQHQAALESIMESATAKGNDPLTIATPFQVARFPGMSFQGKWECFAASGRCVFNTLRRRGSREASCSS
jgi:hypothetical protein